MQNSVHFVNFASNFNTLLHSDLKQFPADKNYILKEVQSDLMEISLEQITSRAISNYLRLYNPMGLRDSTIEKIEAYRLGSNHALNEFYLELAAIYRYLNHGNQLELLFDGSSHYDLFRVSWGECLIEWIDEFSLNETFLKAFLGATVYYQGEQSAELIRNRLRSFLNKRFQLKVYKNWGIREFEVA